MSKTNAKTKLELMGFADSDLRSASHDDLIAAFIPQIDLFVGLLLGYVAADIITSWNVSYKLEVPITEQRRGGFTVGFADMVISATRKYVCADCVRSNYFVNVSHNDWLLDTPDLCLLHKNMKYIAKTNYHYDSEREMNSYHTKMKNGIIADIKRCILCRECYDHGTSGHNLRTHESILVEFKTSPFTAGELLRQINTYRQHFAFNRVLLVTSIPCSHKALLHSENIVVAEYTNSQFLMI
jgi:hypothetical protein